jgi:hypothetical protein
VDAKWEPTTHFFDESNGGVLITPVVDLEDTNPGAIVDGRELKQPLLRTGDPLEKFDVQLQPMPGLRFLVALPAFPVRLMFLIRGQSRHAMPGENAVHGRGRYCHLVKPPEIVPNPASAEMVRLPEIQNLADDLGRGGSRRPPRRAGSIAEACVAVFGVAPLPFVKRFPRNSEPTAHARHIALVVRFSK